MWKNRLALFAIMILLISLLGISSQKVDAFTGFESALKYQDDNPFYCVMQNSVYKNYYWYIQEGTNDWESKLHAKVSTIAQRALWDMSISFVDKKYDGCDVIVYLNAYANAPVKSNGKKALGTAYGNYKIVLYIDNGQEGESVRQVMSHEVGHTLGLGHYVSDEQAMERWGLFSHAPSIMTPTQYWNEKLQGITDNDINKIREVYDDGFSKPPPPPIASTPIIPPYSPPTHFDSKIFLNQPTGKIFTGEQISISGYLGKVGDGLNKRLPSDFEAIPNGKIYFSILGEDLGSATTNSYGRFSFSLTVPTLLCDDCKKQDIPLSSHFKGGTNLDSSSATVVITVHNKQTFLDPIIVQKSPENSLFQKIQEIRLETARLEIEKQEQALEHVIGLRDDFVKTIKDLESSVEISEKSLSGLTFQKKEAQEKINRAWDLLKQNQRKMDDINSHLMATDDNIERNNFDIAQIRIDNGKDFAEKVEQNLVEISKLIEEAKEFEKQKFCFLWLCW